MLDLRYKNTINTVEETIRFVQGKEVKEKKMITIVATPSGEYREKEWIKLIENQANNNYEQEIIDKLKEYALKELPWINKESDAKDYALRLYSSRMFENKKWLGYEEFQVMLNTTKDIKQVSLF